MFSHVGNMGGHAAHYQIPNSLRFRSSAGSYLYRDPSVASNRTTFTFSTWIKLGAIGGYRALLTANTQSDFQNGFEFELMPDGRLDLSCTASGGTSANITTVQLLRDPSAWYHIVLSIDTNQATASNRVKMYVNGLQCTSFSPATYPAQGHQFFINTTGRTYLGHLGYTSSIDYDGYMADVYFIDGQALDASYFGRYCPNNLRMWEPKKYLGTYGTNGFYLPFTNGSTLTTLGTDASGNGNNWTTSGISLTADSTYDWTIDTPTNNFSTLNSIRPHSGSITNGALSNSGGGAGSTWVMDSGKWVAEVKVTVTGTGLYLGICDSNSYASDDFNFVSGNIYNYSSNGGLKNGTGADVSNGTYASYTTGDVIRVELDATNGTCRWFKNNVAQGSGAYSVGTAPWRFMASSTSCSHDWNFGQRLLGSAVFDSSSKGYWINPPTAGFKAPCTANLPAPAITDPAKHFDAVTYTGNGPTGQSIVTPGGFGPDVVWMKVRDTVNNHAICDSVRGVRQLLKTNTTDAEYSDSVGFGLTAFNSNGFTLGADTNTTAGTNSNAHAFISWLFNMGGSTVTNTAGSISSQVRANALAGMSVVEVLSGTGAVGTIGHGLSSAPKFIISKACTSVGVTSHWPVYHASANASPASGRLLLNTTDAFAADSQFWNNTAPTSSVFTVGANQYNNQSGARNIFYCFTEVSGFSKIGSYVGNASADGPFIYCGFRPKYVMTKRIGSSGYDWIIRDIAREPNNYNYNSLAAQSSSAEFYDINNRFDFLSNGFKLRMDGSTTNAADTYVFIAFADLPFGSSISAPPVLAR